jgi:hypothetical protein
MPKSPRRVSQHFQLGLGQAELDFVDVSVNGDTRAFIDPTALRHMRGAWAMECVSLLQDLFDTVLQHVRRGEHQHAHELLLRLSEPNETRLGFSRGRPRGHGVGWDGAVDLWEALKNSNAATTGVLVDLEDAALFIRGIGPDIVSDIATNIIRGPLIAYTQWACDFYGIPISDGIPSGPIWDASGEWKQRFVRLPWVSGRKLLLVPKVAVRRGITFDPGDYWSQYVAPYLCQMEIDARSSLVHTLRDGRFRVHVKDVKRKYGNDKAAIARFTEQHPEVLTRYRATKRDNPLPPMSHEELAPLDEPADQNLQALLDAVISTPVGNEDAHDYHQRAMLLLNALFYPQLGSPQREKEIHEGRKRIDIVYVNIADTGFFRWLLDHCTAPHVLVECKNYANDPKNPELDQLQGRFSKSRGTFGIMVCRRIADKEMFYKRCRDTANDDRGFIIGLDDDDLKTLIELRKEGRWPEQSAFLKGHFDRLVM